jgi:nitrous oxidase accessory protein NosD
MLLFPRRAMSAAAGIALGMLTAAAVANAAAAAPSPSKTIPVSSAGELVRALASAEPGDTIRLAPGTYDGNFVATAKGTANAPITLTGTADSVLSNDSGYGLHLDGAAYWRLTGSSVRRAPKGIVLDGSQHVVIDGVEVSEVNEEGVHADLQFGQRAPELQDPRHRPEEAAVRRGRVLRLGKEQLGQVR